jgi:hypothetical protein
MTPRHAKLVSFVFDSARRPAALALAGYCGVAVVFFFPLLRRITTHILADDVFIRPGQSDAYNFLWTYWWIQRAVSIGESVLHCRWVLPPTGANLVFHTHVLLPTLLTWPLGRLLGSVGGYNLMVLLMVVLGAWSYALFLRRTLDVSWRAAFVVGACFGFSPYFVFKTHAHLNLIGACFWASALGVLVNTYRTQRFNRPRALLFAVFLWASFWTSFVEFFMLVVVSVAVVLVFELRNLRGGEGRIAARVRFFVPALVGAVSLAVLLAAPDVAAVRLPVADPLAFQDLRWFPRLSVFAPLGTSTVYEHWGTFIPISFMVLAGIGLARWIRGKEHALLPIAILVVVTLILTFDPSQGASTVLRRLPLGGGFRVFARFFPFFLFFLLMFAALGLDALLRRWTFRGRHGVIALLLLAAAVELYPYRMQPSPVKQLPMGPEQRARLERGRFVLVLPHEMHLNVHDTYQIALDLPCVHLSYLARERDPVQAYRMTHFPMVYGAAPVTSVAALYEELRALNIGYILIEDKRDRSGLPFRGEAVAEWDREVLLRLE